MIRRIAAMFLLIFFTFSTITFAFNEDVYYNDIKVGLENMMSNSINVELNGDYISGGVLYKKGTSFVISILNGKVSFNNTLYDNISFTPVDNSSTMRLIVGIKRYNFKGQLDFVVKGDMILPINTINIEEYLNGVVGYEMSNSYPLEALKAQAVAARNYASLR
ncbi:hypothetical protein Q428_12265 [Fervidicella metallireducens AeB]|uniref:Sporulation stage II protein D amidase enhancer LytB N-terminal domain-containing protein n=1 Tax=Fervidicella metallireducens AeB TaxID=1403537 RepID=A0A017RSS3_9CLOT|nr:SpoIID/LytB domain-containing protein [Fervidicella metallireducens]EYE87641.1 hypothetical protein Q428_12265 [Fervidicella metallireducens AeB]